jgi:hypothetical protein
MKVQFYRFVLNPATQVPLFKKEKKKKDMALEALGEKYSFDYRGSQLAYVFHRIEGDYLLGSLGKRATLTRSLPPEKDFQETKEENWPHCRVFVKADGDPEEGQTIAIEFKGYIFPEPLHQLRALADKMNEELLTPEYGYTLSVNPVTTKQDFWQLVEQHKAEIEEVEFTFNAPNLFHLENELEDELKDAQKEFAGMTHASVGFHSEGGALKIPKNKFVNQSVDYISRGGGEYKLKFHKKGYVSSKKNVKSKNVEEVDVEIESTDKNLFEHIFDKIFS